MTDELDEFQFDWKRQNRTGVPEVVFAESKSSEQLIAISKQAMAFAKPLFLTRVQTEQATDLKVALGRYVHFDTPSRTLLIADQTLNEMQSSRPSMGEKYIGVVVAGTSDRPVAAEFEQTLLFLGHQCETFNDVGVAGLWRLTSIAEQLQQYKIIIAVAGMEGALFSVLSGLVKAPVIAVPTSVGYGVGSSGQVALHSALCSCSPGLAVVNVDNGFGAAALASKMMNMLTPK